MVRETPRRGRKAILTREMIADAALAIGFDNITMTNVADRLGVSHAALYTHVRDRADLVVAAVDRLAAGIDWPPPDPDWDAYLRAEAAAIYRAMFDHPGLTAALDEADDVPEVFKQHLAEVHAHLVSLGFDPTDAFLAIDLVADLAGDSAQRSAQLVRRGDEARRELGEAWSKGYDEDLRILMADALVADPMQWFDAKLNIVMAGIEVRLAPGSR